MPHSGTSPSTCELCVVEQCNAMNCVVEIHTFTEVDLTSTHYRHTPAQFALHLEDLDNMCADLLACAHGPDGLRELCVGLRRDFLKNIIAYINDLGSTLVADTASKCLDLGNPALHYQRILGILSPLINNSNCWNATGESVATLYEANNIAAAQITALWDEISEA